MQPNSLRQKRAIQEKEATAAFQQLQPARIHEKGRRTQEAGNLRSPRNQIRHNEQAGLLQYQGFREQINHHGTLEGNESWTYRFEAPRG